MKSANELDGHKQFNETETKDATTQTAQTRRSTGKGQHWQTNNKRRPNYNNNQQHKNTQTT